LGYDVDLHIDSSGRLWVGDNDGIRVLNVANDSFEVVAERSGFDATRFALREDGDTVHAYYARFRDPATIGHLAIDF
jgi:ligand-binding sensor domain-containing protein